MRTMMCAAMMASLGALGCSTSEVATEDATSAISSYQVARTVAAGLGSRDRGGATGAFYDGALLARGNVLDWLTKAGDGVFYGRHDGIDYFYRVSCQSSGGPVDLVYRPGSGLVDRSHTYRDYHQCGVYMTSATVTASWEETRGMPDFASTTRHDVMWTMKVLDDGGASIRGVATTIGSLSFTDSGTATRYSLDEASTFNLRLGYNDYLRHFGGYSVDGGTLDVDMTAKAADDAATDVHGLVMFEKGQAPLLLVNGDRFPLDLATGDVQSIGW